MTAVSIPYGTIIVPGSHHGPGSPLPMPRTRTHIFAPEVSPSITVRTFELGATPRHVAVVQTQHGTQQLGPRDGPDAA